MARISWKVRWLRMQKIQIPDGTTHLANVGELRWCCGVSIACWPMKTKATCIHEFQTVSSFKADLVAVRAGVQQRVGVVEILVQTPVCPPQPTVRTPCDLAGCLR